MDGTLILGDRFNVTGQVVRTHGPFEQGRWAFFLRPSYDSSTSHFHVRYSSLGERVADNLNAVGFVADDDRREGDSAFSRRLVALGRSGEAHLRLELQRLLEPGGTAPELEDRRGPQRRLAQPLERRGQLLGGVQGLRGGLRNRQVGLAVGYNTREYQQVLAGYEFGNFGSDYQLVTGRVRRKLSPALSAEYELQWLTLTPDPEGKSTWIHVVRASQFFTKDLYLKVFFQTNSAIDRQNLQAIFVYRYRPPFGTLQLAFQRGTAAFGQRSSQGNTVFLKATAVF